VARQLLLDPGAAVVDEPGADQRVEALVAVLAAGELLLGGAATELVQLVEAAVEQAACARGDRVVTPHGTGSWEIGIQGEKIVAVALPGTLAAEAARTLDATGKIVVPGVQLRANSFEVLIEVLRAKLAAGADPTGRILIGAEPGVQYQHVVSAMDACVQAGFSNIQFSVSSAALATTE
jgi:hypothetical protein